MKQINLKLAFTLLGSAIISFFSLSAHAAVYTVNGLGDAGAGAGLNGDLRYCINQANAIAGPHTINFSVAGTITLTGNLPVFTRQITIAGNTAPGYAVNAPVVQINGNGAAGWCFLLNNAGGANSIIRGLVMNRATISNFTADGVGNITIEDCFLGTNMAGNASTGGNPAYGITLANSPNSIIRNCVSSGHTQHGMLIFLNSTDVIVRGCRVGTNNLGTAAIPNTLHGIEINNNCLRPIIGGAALADRNIIAGNGQIGLSINGLSTNPQVINNYLGVNAAGTAAIGNGFHGLFINDSGNSTITDNVASGNGIFGMLITNCNTHVVRGNKVGTNAAGTAALPNVTAAGISFVNCSGITLGGTLAGQGNVLSGNGDVGLRFENSPNATMQGNFIGTNGTGMGMIPNTLDGIYATTASNNHQLGGTTAAARNIISGNTRNGIFYENGCNDLIIEGNYFGPNAAGAGAIGNGQIGIKIVTNCLRTRIGGTATNQRNIVSGNGRLWFLGCGCGNGSAIQFENACNDAVIQGNYVGLQPDGATPLPNTENAIVFLGNCNNFIIGGATAATRNVVSSNGQQGIVINGSHNGRITGNYCGLDVTGTLARGNGQSGIILIFANNCQLGRAIAGEGNVLSNNGELGLHLVGGSPGTVYNNLIGVAANGTTAMGNRNGGVYIVGVAGGTNGSDYTVGGLGALQSNTIAYSTGTGANPALGNGFGIGVAHNDQGLRNTFINNKIYCNAGLGINLNFAGATQFDAGLGVGNGGKTAPVVTSVSATLTSGTGTNGDVIHLYTNNTCIDCEGEVYLGTTTVAGGIWSIAHAAVPTPTNNSATATNASQGTSQFACHTSLPVSFSSFYVKLFNQDYVAVTWSTALEINNDRFEVQKSKDGIHFETIAVVKGKGNSSTINNYSFNDYSIQTGAFYYRIKQIDFDGQFSYTEIKSINLALETTELIIYPNPNNGVFTIGYDNDSHAEVSISNIVGQVVYSHQEYQSGNSIDLSSLPKGIYLASVILNNYTQIIKVRID